MSQTGLKPIDSSAHITNLWLKDIAQRLGWRARRRAYHALRAVLHALRDRLSADQSAALAAQLPLLIRGIYFEGWHPHGKPVKERHKEHFFAHVKAAFPGMNVNAEKITQAVLDVLQAHVTSGEIESVKRSLPKELRCIFTSEPECCAGPFMTP